MLGNYETIEKEIIEFRKHIENYELALNTEAVWLFIATLGCWGVSNSYVKLFAFGLTAVLFGKRFLTKIGDTRSLKDIADTIEKKINESELEVDIKKARLFDLDSIRKTQFAIKPKKKDFNSFFFCWLFYAVSTSFALYELPKPGGG